MLYTPYQSKFYHQVLKEGAVGIFISWLIEFRRFLYRPTVYLVFLELSQMGSRMIIAAILTQLQSENLPALSLLVGGILIYDMLSLSIDVLFTRSVIMGIGYDLSYALEWKVISHVTTLGHTFFTGFPISKTLDRIDKTSRVADLMREGYWNFINNMIQATISMAVLLVLAPISVPVVLICLIVFFSINSKLIAKQAPARRRRKDLEEEKSELHMRLIAANVTLLNNDALGIYMDQLFRLYRRIRKVGELELNHNLKLPGILRDVALFAGRRAVLAIAILLTVTHVIDNPKMVLIFTIAETMFIGFWGAVRFVQSFVYEIPSILKVDELLRIKATITEPKKPRSLPKRDVSVVIKKVNFTYKDTFDLVDDDDMRDKSNIYKIANIRRKELGLKEVFQDSKKNAVSAPHLCDINLVIHEGEKIAVVGRSGSGKTTLTYLLSKHVLPDSGQILINDTDITEVDGEELRKLIGVVPQGDGVYIFQASLRENITLGGNYTDEQVEQALKVAELWDFVQEKLPLLYWSEIGEKGTKLSGGQKQRVAIARVAIRIPKLIILDEATSALDPKTEKLVQRSFKKLLKGRTSITVAHRLSTIREADRIIVMKDGQIVGIGTYDELLESNVHFQELANPQLDEEE